MNKELKRWLKANNAYKQCIDSVLKNKITNMHDAYNRAESQYLVWAVTRKGIMTQRDCIRFALFCVKQVQDKLTDERSKAVIPALEGWLGGTVGNNEIKRVANAAYVAVNAADAYTTPVAHVARKLQAEWIRANVPFESLNLKVIR
jgi:hypothetical protein